MTEEINKLKAQFDKGFITSDLISSYISLRLDEAGQKYDSVSSVRFDIFVDANAKLQADITNLIKQIGSVEQSRVVPLIDHWFDRLMDAISKSKRIEVNKSNESLVVRVRSNKIIKSFSKSKGISFDEALRSFSLFEPGRNFFICIGEDDDRAVSMSSVSLINGVDNWDENVFVNLSHLIRDDFELSGIGGVANKPDAVMIATEGDLCYSFPMSRPHRELLSEILDAEPMDLNYVLSERNETAHAFRAGDKNAIKILKEMAAHYGDDFEIFEINESGFLQVVGDKKAAH